MIDAKLRSLLDDRCIPEPNSGCWLWTRATTGAGYGNQWWQGKHWNAHKLSWGAEFGPVPDGLHVLHKCDVKACINPGHLYLGTRSRNVRDALERGQIAPRQGEDQANSFLTEAQVRSIRADGRPQKEIAAAHGISPSHVSKLKGGKAWKHLERKGRPGLLSEKGVAP